MFKKYIDNYYINEKGIVKNILTNKEYKGIKDRNGYLRVDVSIKGKRKVIVPHRAVAETFIPNPKNKSQVNHINGIKTDNRVENLEWTTPSENMQHASKHNLLKIHNKMEIKILKDGKIYTYCSVAEFLRKNKISNTSYYRNKEKTLTKNNITML